MHRVCQKWRGDAEAQGRSGEMRSSSWRKSSRTKAIRARARKIHGSSSRHSGTGRRRHRAGQRSVRRPRKRTLADRFHELARLSFIALDGKSSPVESTSAGWWWNRGDLTSDHHAIVADLSNGPVATSIDVQPMRRPEILLATGKFERLHRQTGARPRLTSSLAAKPCAWRSDRLARPFTGAVGVQSPSSP